MIGGSSIVKARTSGVSIHTLLSDRGAIPRQNAFDFAGSSAIALTPARNERLSNFIIHL
jgi:hypothetical protein